MVVGSAARACVREVRVWGNRGNDLCFCKNARLLEVSSDIEYKMRTLAARHARQHPLFGFIPLSGHPNPFVDLPILTPLPRKETGASDSALSRNYVNALTSDVVPGSKGTLDEIRPRYSLCQAIDVHRAGTRV